MLIYFKNVIFTKNLNIIPVAFSLNIIYVLMILPRGHHFDSNHEYCHGHFKPQYVINPKMYYTWYR